MESQVAENLRADAGFVLQLLFPGRSHVRGPIPAVRDEAVVFDAQAGAGLVQVNQTPAPSRAIAAKDPEISLWQSHSVEPRISP